MEDWEQWEDRKDLLKCEWFLKAVESFWTTIWALKTKVKAQQRLKIDNMLLNINQI